MYDDNRIEELTDLYRKLSEEERVLQRKLDDVRNRKTEIQRDIARNQSAQLEAKVFGQLYDQRIANRSQRADANHNKN